MIFKHAQNWRTSMLPYSLALMNTVNTGGSFTTPSGAVANSKWWATRGFQGYGPKIQYPRGAGMDGCGCGCGGGGGCRHHGDDMSGLLCIAALAGVVYLMCNRHSMMI